MNRSEYFKGRYHSDNVSLVLPLSPLDSYNPMDIEVSQTMFPVDKYGRLSDLLSRMLQTDSTLERNQLLSLLDDTSSPVGKEFARLDDETKMQLLKPRSVQSFVEIERYSEYVSDFIEKNNVKVSTEPTEPIEPNEPTEPTEPNV
nr:MAG TPA: hypothetical protein [Microviridae sp.]